MEYKRLTTDNPKNMVEAMLNFAIAKDGTTVLRYADGEEDKNLCEYLFEQAKNHNYNCVSSADAILQGDCLSCDCIINVLYITAVQAAELREGLKMLEDKIENGELVEQKQGEWVDRYKNKYDNHLYECSICKQEALWKVGINELLSPTVTQALTPYCPHCNAKMRC